MVSHLKLWVSARSEANALRLGKKVITQVSKPITLLSTSPYPKTNGYILSFTLHIDNDSWSDSVYEALIVAQELGYGWIITGTLAQEFNVTSTNMKIPGIEMAEILLTKEVDQLG